MLLAVNNYAKKLPSDINILCDVIKDTLKHIREALGITDECCLFELKVILNELLSNAVRHGNKNDKSKYVNLTIIKKGNFLHLTIEDEGQGYNYRELLFRKMKVDFEDIFSLSETGRGLHIVKNLCDELWFNKQGNRVTVVKRI